jgi:hydrogenase-4 component E
MTSPAELVLVLVVVTDFAVLATARLSSCIRAIAAQGLLLGALPFLVEGHLTAHTLALGLGTMLIKAGVLPWLLRRAMREAAVRREVEPLIGAVASMLLGALALAIGFAVAGVLPLHAMVPELLVPVALVTLVMGLIVLTTRSKAITQVVGYLMFENGIFLFGLTQSQRVPFLVEIGVLLDVLAGVFIMGIVVFHINREFDSISSAKLVDLRD